MNHFSKFYEQNRNTIWLAQAVVFLGFGLLVGLSIRGKSAERNTSDQAKLLAGTKKSAEAASIWTCSMHPQIRRDGPGKCPLCGMKLVPVKKSAGGVRTISISPNVKKLMNIQTVPVGRRYVTANVRMVGKIEYDETRTANITAWVSGRLDRLYVDFTGAEVNKGDHMVYIYSEELYSAQEELILAINSKVESATTRFVKPIDLAESAREKLRLLGITDKQIQEIEQRGKANDHVTIYSPVSGIIIEKLREEGDRVRTGDRIYTVADLSRLWVQMDAYESDLAWLRYGQEVEFSTEAYPGEVFKGQIAFINPILNAATRTVKVRVNVSNEDGRLKPEMFVRATVRSTIASGGRVLDASLAGKWISPMHPENIKDEPGNCDVCGMPLVKAESLGYVTAEPDDAAKPLVIPVSAALLTGTRAIVYVQVPDTEEPTYEGREIVIGARAGDYYLVKTGLEDGELVVTNGNFKIDSALQISAKPSMMTPEGGGGGGHNHGGGTKPSKNGQPAKKMGMSIPTQLETQLRQAIAAVDKIAEAIESAELGQIREAFDQLGKQVASIDTSLLSGKMKGQLQEFTMLLGNDSVEGKEITVLKNADRIFLVTKRHAQRLQTMFGISHAGDQMQEQPLVVSAEFRSQLSQLIPAYLAIGKTLAADDSDSAANAIAGLHQAIKAIKPQSLDEKGVKRWNSELKSLFSIVARFSKADDLAALRSAFALLSDELLTLQRTFGFQNSETLFSLHCPMAFGGRGASWIQADDAVRNPYYGKSMLTCADRVDPLGIKDKANEKTKAGEHAGHK